MRIRAAHRRDRDIIWRATLETVWDDLPKDEQRTTSHSDFEAHFRPHAARVIGDPRNAIFVAETDAGAVVGYTIVGRMTTMLSPEPSGFVYDLWVAPDARRRGIGHRLIERAKEWCRGEGLHKLRLEVGADNEAARTFYKSEGFLEERLSLGKPL